MIKFIWKRVSVWMGNINENVKLYLYMLYVITICVVYFK